MMRLTIKPLARSGVKKLTKQHIRNNNEEQDTATIAATVAIVGDDKDAVVLTLGYRHGEVALEVGGKDYLLMLIG